MGKNIQVTFDTSTNNARSESSITINPKKINQMVAGSKKFNNIQNYDFTLATSWSNDGGHTWHPQSQPFTLPTGATGMSDPAITWDKYGNVWLAGLILSNPPQLTTLGIAMYKSTDGGQTWSQPNMIHQGAADDKQWIAADFNNGNVYVIWDGAGGLLFARLTSQGGSWTGTGNNPPGSVIGQVALADIDIANDGTIYIVGMTNNGLGLLISTDQGNSFQPGTPPATGITPLGGNGQPVIDSWPVFPGGTFRTTTIPSLTVGPGNTLAVAWADFREGVSRIYYAVSPDGGQTWTTGPSGQPLLTGQPMNMHQFHPQLVFDPYGNLGCAFYEFGPKPTTPLIDVRISFSYDSGKTFGNPLTVTDQPWNPAIDAPFSHGDPNVTFIGDYFGLDASKNGFFPLWTDTRTKIQELWTMGVPAQSVVSIPSANYGLVAQIIAGIIQDGGGIENVGGHIIHVPPWGPPEVGVLLGVACHRIAGLMNGSGAAIQRAALQSIVHIAEGELSRMRSEGATGV